jgi:hypothetical protein
MIIYRIMVKTSRTGGMFMDGTSSLALAIKEAEAIQTENPQYNVSIEAEEWPSLTSIKYHWYQFTGKGEGFGTEFQKKYGHKHIGAKHIWPKP